MSEQVAAQTEAGVKCFVGNLSFQTTADILKSKFESVKAEVVHIDMHRGYCFINVATQEQAEAAVASLHGTDLEERKIRVELARPQEAREPGQQRKSKPRRNDAAKGEESTTKKTRQPRGPRRAHGDKTSAESTDAAATATDGVAAITEGVDNAQIADKTKKAPRQKQTRVPREPPSGPESKTDVFVRNLDFNTKNEDLAAEFAKNGIQVVSTDIKYRTITSKNGQPSRQQSKGFAFVVCADEANQKAAIALSGQLVVDQRKLTIKAAIDQVKTEAQDSANVEASA